MKRFKRLSIFLVIIILLVVGTKVSWAEENAEENDNRVKEIIAGFSLAPKSFNSVALNTKEKKYWLRASSETIGTSLVVWAFDRYVLNLDYMARSFDTVIKNIRRGYGWDAGSFVGNQFAHSYHGGIFFTAGRVNGFNFWESSIFSFFGSFIWEIAAETSRPSTNDCIMTTIGGMFLGEIIFRFSDLIIDESATGMTRISQEVLVLFINPVFSFDRLITGKMFRKGYEAGDYYYNLATLVGSTSYGLMVGVDLEYKDVFRRAGLKVRPYDYFRFELRTGFDIIARLQKQRLISSGILFGKKIEIMSDNDSLIGIFANFDFIDIPDNKISAVGIGPGLFTGLNLGSGLFMNTFTSLSGVFGGSTSSFASSYGKEIFARHGETYQFGSEKDPYYLGPGITGKLEIELGKKNYGSIYAGIYHHWIHSIFATMAEESVTRLHFRVGLDTGKQSQVRLEYELYLRQGTYRDYPLLRKQDHTLSLFYVLKF